MQHKSLKLPLFVALLVLLSLTVIPALAAPAEFDLIAPADGAELTLGAIPDPLTLEWEEAADAVSYTWRVWAGEDTGGAPAATVDVSAATCEDDVCTFDLPGANAVANAAGTYTWDILAADASDPVETTASTSQFTFVVSEEVTGPGAFDLLTPPNGAELTLGSIPAEITVTWEASEGATSYTWSAWLPGSDTTGDADLSETGTPAEDDDAITCADGTCSLTIEDAPTVLAAEGVYTWDVVASDGTDTTDSTNGPFTFTVLPQPVVVPGSFTLIAPGSSEFPGPVLRGAALSAEATVTWTASSTASSYDFVLFQISENNTRLMEPVFLGGLSPEADDDALVCTEAVCTLVVDISGLTDGLYSWTVIANNDDGQTEASNAPFFFEVDSDAISLLSESWEDYGSNQPRPDWVVRRNTGGDRIRCNNNPTQDFGNTGDCTLQLRDRPGTPNALYRYVLRPVDFEALNLTAGDTLNLSAFIRTFGANNDGGQVVRLFVRYSDRDDQDRKIRQNAWLTLPAVQTPAAYAEVAESLVLLSSNVELIRVDIRESGLNGGRFWIDDVELSLVTAELPAPEELLPLPLPAPADFSSSN
jgi:hypothetical protein